MKNTTAPLCSEKRSKFGDVLVTTLFVLIIFGFSIAIFIIPDKKFSNDENRSLQVFPTYPNISAFTESFFSGDFGKKISDYYADQFPLRDAFVGVKAMTERVMLEKQNNDVIFGKDGSLITRFYYPDVNIIDANIKKINKALSGLGIPAYICVPPRTQDVMSVWLPDGFPEEPSNEAFEALENELADTQIKYIDLRSALLAKADMGEQIYYRTDHHWESLGAYYAYREIADNIGFKPKEPDEFSVKTVTDSFFGTTWSKAGAKWIKPDSIESYEPINGSRFEVDIMKYRDGRGDIARTMDGFYDESCLTTKDKYAYFLSGNYADVSIRKITDEKRETLLVIKDSFVNSLVPFLAQNYDIRLIDPRQYTGKISDIVASGDYCAILCCINMDIISGSDVKIA